VEITKDDVAARPKVNKALKILVASFDGLLYVSTMTSFLTPSFPCFGKRLKRQRLAVGMKQQALASALNVTQTTVSRWEGGVQVPDAGLQYRAMDWLVASRAEDAALKRLVEGSSHCVHLVDEASHKCLAYSPSRARDWNASSRGLLGVSLWQFATDEIRRAECELEDHGWWEEIAPTPRRVVTSEAIYAELKISAGGMLWERMYLSDGRPVRLVTGLHY
jgi:transcriptional regulator with XRE-family HTH domain